jgi:chromosome segregation ATPase
MSEDPILAAIEQLRTDLGGRIDGLDGRIDSLRNQLDERDARLMSWVNDGNERILNQLTAIREDIATNYGTADAVRRANDNTREELKSLSDVVAAMQRQYLRLRSEVDELKRGRHD